MILRVLLNVLALLRGDPQTFDELLSSDLFPRIQDLEYQLSELERMKIIVSNTEENGETYYALTDMGRAILRTYPSIHLKTVDLVYNKETRSYLKLVYPTYPR
jgi:predicted transcriptional regulator